jgi:undecaprenyl-diphosphatase
VTIALPKWLEAVILGLIQGLTEFLPVSSSGHLTIAPYLFSFEQPTLAFGVLLHIATLLAVLAYFRHDLWFLMRGLAGASSLTEADHRRARRTTTLLVLGSLPAAAIGLVLENLVGELFENPLVAAGFLLVTAALLWFAEGVRRRRTAEVHGEEAARANPGLDVGRDEGTVGVMDATVIGFAQALAIFPGISRAGSTMAAGMVRGLSRTGAARFSFLLSIPVIAGAGLFELTEFEAGAFGTFSTTDVAAATVAAALSGYWAIRFLLRLVSADDLTGFARYLVVVGLLTLSGYFWLGPPGTLG